MIVMAIVRTIVTSSGAEVKLHDDAYSVASAEELSYRRDNLLNTAERAAQRTQQQKNQDKETEING